MPISRFLNSFFIFLTVVLLIPKSTNASTIDNILNTLFYSHNDSSYLILHESVFHPTSGSYEKGNLRSQGYNSSQISVYNLLNGKLVAQKQMGKIDSTENCILLGCSENNLWMYSKKYKSGLQSLHPLTLKTKITQAQIYKSLKTSIGRFNDAKWQTIRSFYGFDAIQQKLIITNIDNKQYYIDISTFTTQEITEKIILETDYNDYFSESVLFNDTIWKLDGYKEMTLKCGNYEIFKPTFLYGRFILEQNKLKLFNLFFSIQEERLFRNIEDSTTSLQLATQNNMLEISRNNISNLILGKKPKDILLQTDANSLYIFSKSKDQPDAFINITKLKSDTFGEFTTEWSTSISGMFYNIAQARKTRKFKQYFGDIIPESDYQFIQTFNNKLIVIYLSHVCCINTQNGKTIWKFKL